MNELILNLIRLDLGSPKDSTNSSWEKECCSCQRALTPPTKRNTRAHMHCSSRCLSDGLLAIPAAQPVIYLKNRRSTLSVPKNTALSLTQLNSQRLLLSLYTPEKWPHTVQFSNV